MAREVYDVIDGWSMPIDALSPPDVGHSLASFRICATTILDAFEACAYYVTGGIVSNGQRTALE